MGPATGFEHILFMLGSPHSGALDRATRRMGYVFRRESQVHSAEPTVFRSGDSGQVRPLHLQLSASRVHTSRNLIDALEPLAPQRSERAPLDRPAGNKEPVRPFLTVRVLNLPRPTNGTL